MDKDVKAGFREMLRGGLAALSVEEITLLKQAIDAFQGTHTIVVPKLFLLPNRGWPLNLNIATHENDSTISLTQAGRLSSPCAITVIPAKPFSTIYSRLALEVETVIQRGIDASYPLKPTQVIE